MTQTPNESGRAPVEPQSYERRRDRGRATPSRLGSLWVASILFAVVLLLLLIFVLQNGQSAQISYLGAHGHVPQGVALLLAAVFGILLVALPGTARIIQLRIRDRRHRGTARTQPSFTPPPAGTVEAIPATTVSAAPTAIDAPPPAVSEPPVAPVATQPGAPSEPPVQSPPPADRR